ncbi:hypothetical protein ACFPRL_33550 [Pseudoclavibacter helvolus]
MATVRSSRCTSTTACGTFLDARYRAVCMVRSSFNAPGAEESPRSRPSPPPTRRLAGLPATCRRS